MAYIDEGPREPPPAGVPAAHAILLVHGWGVSGELFHAQVGPLSSRFRVIVPDLPGHGASAPFPRDGRFGLLADTLSALIAELRLDSVCLVGWSLGAMVCWDLLRRYPETPVTGLVTIDMVPRLLNNGDWSFGLREGSDRHAFDRQVRVMSDDWRACTKMFVPRIFAANGAGAANPALASATEVALRNDPASMASIWQEMVEQDFRDDLSTFDLPTLLIAGARSQLYRPAAAEWIAKQLPQARLKVFDDSGHAPHVEQPEEFNRLLADFAGSLRTRNFPGHTGHRSLDPNDYDGG